MLEWDNIYYEKPTTKATAKKKVVRLGLIQWQMRPYKDFDELMHQAEYFVDAVSGYRADFLRAIHFIQHQYHYWKYAHHAGWALVQRGLSVPQGRNY